MREQHPNQISSITHSETALVMQEVCSFGLFPITLVPTSYQGD